MRQIVPRQLLREPSRKQLLLVAAVAVVCVGGWSVVRGRPRTFEETAWDDIVFSEMANPPILVETRDSQLPASMAATTFVAPLESASRGMRVEMAANVPLDLDGNLRVAPIQGIHFDGVSQVAEPTWLEGGIEAVDATMH